MTQELHNLAAVYALDALPDEERHSFEEHLAGCAACRQEVVGFHETAARLGIVAWEAPPPDLRQRVLRSIAEERIPARQPRRRWAPALAAAIALVAVGVVAVAVRPDQEADRSEQIVEILAAPDAITLQLQAPAPTVARFFYSSLQGRGVLVADGLESPPEDRIYAFWLIGDQEAIPAGLFRPDAEGRATHLVEGDLEAAAAVGVTVEPAGGSPQPTGEVLIFAELRPAESA